MKHRHRLLRLMLLGALAGATIASAAAIFLLRDATARRTAERLRSETMLVARWAEDPSAVADAPGFAARVARSLGVRVSLIAADGTLVGDSARDPASLSGIESHLERPEIRDARLRGSGEAERRSRTTHVRYHYSAARVAGPGIGSICA